MTILEQAKNLLEALPLCDHCLGRQFALLGHGLGNDQRGHAIKLLLVAEADRQLRENEEKGKQALIILARNSLSEIAKTTAAARGAEVKGKHRKCALCQDTFADLDQYAEEAKERMTGHEFESFLVGIHVPPEVEEREDELRARYGLSWGESIRNEFSREIGKRLQATTGKAVDQQHPQLLVMLDPFNDELSLEVSSVYVSGRYRKLTRTLPQSRWLCSHCQGRGCDKCGGTGKLYQESVEELVGGPAMAAAEGVEYHLHAAGREDVDVRTLGTGRPFVLEVVQPKRRSLNLPELTDRINTSASGKIEVTELRPSSKEEVRRLKAEGQKEKTYRALVEFDGEVDESRLEQLKGAFVGQPLSQLTPTRVMHRRALRARKKYIYELETRRLQPDRAELLIRCQGGLYVKEFISGDEGRTKPSVAEILGVPARCIELDVLNIDVGEIE
jgi:tRNA pseudouridine synthase 10